MYLILNEYISVSKNTIKLNLVSYENQIHGILFDVTYFAVSYVTVK